MKKKLIGLNIYVYKGQFINRFKLDRFQLAIELHKKEWTPLISSISHMNLHCFLLIVATDLVVGGKAEELRLKIFQRFENQSGILG